MATTNEEVAKAIIETPDAESVTKAIRRGISVSDILDRERGDWLQRHRGVVVKKESRLGHPNIHKTFERYFEKMSQYLFFIPVLGRVLVAEKNHKDVMAVEDAIIKSMQGAIAIFDERIGQYKAAKAAHNIPDGDYNKSYAIEVSFTSPLDKLYFQVLEKADLCMLLNYNLWVENALNPDYKKNELHRTENEWEVKRQIKNCNYQVIINYRRLLNSINRDQRARRASDAQAQAPVQDKPAAANADAAAAAPKAAKPAKAAKVVKAAKAESSTGAAVAA